MRVIIIGLVLALATQLVLVEAQAQILDNFCKQDALASFVKSQISTVSYQYSKNYLGTDKEGALLMVSKTDATTVFKMKTTLKTGLTSDWKDCTGTSEYKDVNLVQDMLFLKKSDNTQYFVCKYTSGTDSLVVTKLNIPTQTNFISLKPFYQSDGLIYAAANFNYTDTWTLIFKYTYDASASSLNPESVNSNSKKISPALDLSSQIGTSLSIYRLNGNDKAILTFNSADSQFKSQTTTGLRTSDLVDYSVKIYKFLSSMTIITTIKSTNFVGKAWYLNSASPTPSEISKMSISSSVIQIKDYSNNLYSLGRVSQGKLTWSLMDSTNTQLSTYEILNPVGASNTVLFVGFSQNKALVFSTINTLSVYKIKDGFVITVFKDKPITQPLNPVGSSNPYKVSLNCLCNQIRALSCFAETLVCFILNKAADLCSIGEGERTSSW